MIGISGKFRQNIMYSGLPPVLAMLIILQVGRKDEFILFLHMLLAVFGYIASVQDVKTKRIPNKLIAVMIVAWIIAGIPFLILETSQAITLFIDSAIGFALGGVLFLLVYLISKKGIGGGDVKLIAAAGLYLGLYGIVPAIFYGSILAAITGVVLILIRKINRRDTIPLAPFLYAGMLATMFLS